MANKPLGLKKNDSMHNLKLEIKAQITTGSNLLSQEAQQIIGSVEDIVSKD
mgnify:FL=1